jgi:hypothetical protein
MTVETNDADVDRGSFQLAIDDIDFSMEGTEATKATENKLEGNKLAAAIVKAAQGGDDEAESDESTSVGVCSICGDSMLRPVRPESFLCGDVRSPSSRQVLIDQHRGLSHVMC